MGKIELRLKNMRGEYEADKCARVSISVTNHSENDVQVSRDALMLDGFRSNKFTITDKAQTETFPYIGKYVKYHPEKITIKSGETVTSELDLSEAYDLANMHGGEYVISFNSPTVVCDINGCTGITFHDEILYEA